MQSCLQSDRPDSGLTLVEALVALVISSFVLLALGNLTWFMVARHHRLNAAETEVQEANAFSQTMNQLIKEADARSIRLSLTSLSLATIGLPQSVAAERIRTVQIDTEVDGVLRQVSMGILAAPPGATTELEERRQPLLTALTRLSVAVRVRGTWLETWQGEGPAPDRIRFTWRRSGGPARSLSFLLGKPPLSVACLRDVNRVDCEGAP